MPGAQDRTLFVAQLAEIGAAGEEGVEHLPIGQRLLVALILAFGLAGFARDRALPGALFRGLLLRTLLGRLDALLARDQRVELVELGHDGVVTGFELGAPRLVGVALDLVERRTRVGDELQPLLVQLLESHCRVSRWMRKTAARNALQGHAIGRTPDGCGAYLRGKTG
jgi:hypothetical protein